MIGNMKYFLYKLILFVALIIGLQIVIAKYIAPRLTFIAIGIPGISKLDEYLTQRYPIIYFGDSTIRATAPEDVDLSSIVDMISKISGLKIGDLSSPAYHPGIFEALVRYIGDADAKPDALIVPVNLRSFSPEWDMQPSYQFEKEIFLLTHGRWLTYFSKPLSVFRALSNDSVSTEMYHQTPVFRGDEKVGTVGEFLDEAKLAVTSFEHIRDMYVLDYMYTVKTDHRKMVSLKHIAEIAQQSGIKLFVYITPIDYQGGIRYVGDDFIPQIKKNTETICNMFREFDIECLDLSHSLDSSYFSHEAYPNEHLNEKGRHFVAEKVAAELTDFGRNVIK
jgi:hypothetical protein